MKICAAQTRPIKGDIENNIAHHVKLIELAISHHADFIVFPELSLTGYEPRLASLLAMNVDDGRLDVFQKISDHKKISIVVGAPIKSNDGIYISLIIFQPYKKQQIYSKEFLHPDEETFFISGKNNSVDLPGDIALAICYELSVPEHSLHAFKQRAKVYIASVAKSAIGYEKSSKILSNVAAKYSMVVLMTNCLGYCDNFECVGQTSAWDTHGTLLGQLDDAREGIIIVDMNTLILEKFYI